MIRKKRAKMSLVKAVFGVFFLMMGFFTGVVGIVLQTTPTYAVESTNTVEEANESQAESTENNATVATASTTTEDCKSSLGALGWLICPTTGKIAEAVDWLYEKIEDVLVINPIEMKDGTPIYEIWKYCRSITNIVFIIFFLVVIYSQLTGVGISNYGIKKVLPKMIVVAILVNLSFLICSLMVDVSNIVGDSLRGVFTAIEESTMTANGFTASSHLSMGQMYAAMAGGTALAIGAGIIAFETGAIWMLIPTVLGAIVAVASGLITIALRQAVVALLIMISPLAVVAYMLPNTEDLFKKWKKLLTRMLVFYPMFSLLFGASQLAGFAIIASAGNGFGILLGVAVQVFPLFFSWKLMQMSGTFLGDINTRLRGLATRPLATNRAWADSHRQLTRQAHLARNKAYTPSLRLMQFISNRRVAREEEISEHAETVKLRGQAYNVRRKYGRNGMPGKGAEEDYAEQAEKMQYSRTVDWHKNNLNKGLGQLAVVQNASAAKRARLNALDAANVGAADELKMELARGAKIEYDNAKGFHGRITNAINAHGDLEAIKSGDVRHQLHGVLGDKSNIARYNTMKKIMEGSDIDTSFIAADAAHTFNAQSQIMRGKFKDHFDLTAPTQDVYNLLGELTKSKNPNMYIDQIIAGLRTLNMRGDTDLVEQQLSNVLEGGNIELGTYASQSLANFLMFDVKGNDPFLRRFGKYINLETAKMYNEAEPENRRTRKDVSMYEYVNGEYIDQDADGNIIYDDSGQPKIRKAKRGAAILLKGTSFKDMERTAIADMDQAIRKYSVDIDDDGNKTFNYEKFKKNEAAIWDAIMPNIISDQYSFLSGSEQIIALGKGLSGVDVQKHSFDWEGIFGKDLAEQLTPEQKKDYIKFLNKRMKTFLGGQVPSQIAKTKTDMLESVRNQYALKNAVENDPEFLERISQPGYKMSNDEYKEFEKMYMDDIRKEFVESFKEDALKGFVKMHHKGYQGEAKDGLIQLLDPDELYKKFFPNGDNDTRSKKRRQRYDEDDDGMPVGMDNGFGGGDGGAFYNAVRNDIEDLYENYTGSMGHESVADFWERVKDIVGASDEVSSKEAFFQDIEDSLSQYTNVATLYRDIMNKLFGGF